MEDHLQRFASYLTVTRARGAKTVLQLARESGITTGKIGSWESNLQLPREEDLPLVAKIYGCDLAELETKFKMAKAYRDKYFNVHKRVKPERKTLA